LFRYSILVLPDEVSETASGLLDEVANDPILTPFLWPSEMANVLLMAERRGRISAAQRDQAFVLLDRLPITVAPFDRVLEWPITYALARRFGLTFYDACYVRLSARLGVPLASLDKQMTDAAKVLGVQLAL
jgi:predicted nucleic acid-binding protein